MLVYFMFSFLLGYNPLETQHKARSVTSPFPHPYTLLDSLTVIFNILSPWKSAEGLDSSSQLPFRNWQMPLGEKWSQMSGLPLKISLLSHILVSTLFFYYVVSTLILSNRFFSLVFLFFSWGFGKVVSSFSSCHSKSWSKLPISPS